MNVVSLLFSIFLSNNELAFSEFRFSLSRLVLLLRFVWVGGW